MATCDVVIPCAPGELTMCRINTPEEVCRIRTYDDFEQQSESCLGHSLAVDTAAVQLLIASPALAVEDVEARPRSSTSSSASSDWLLREAPTGRPGLRDRLDTPEWWMEDCSNCAGVESLSIASWSTQWSSLSKSRTSSGSSFASSDQESQSSEAESTGCSSWACSSLASWSAPRSSLQLSGCASALKWSDISDDSIPAMKPAAQRESGRTRQRRAKANARKSVDVSRSRRCSSSTTPAEHVDSAAEVEQKRPVIGVAHDVVQEETDHLPEHLSGSRARLDTPEFWLGSEVGSASLSTASWFTQSLGCASWAGSSAAVIDLAASDGQQKQSTQKRESGRTRQRRAKANASDAVGGAHVAADT